MLWQVKQIRWLEHIPNRIRRILRRTARHWAYGLVLIPVIAEWLDKAHFPSSTWEVAKTGFLSTVIGVCIWRLYRDSKKLKRLSETDDLTGLHNRRKFNEDLAMDATRARRLGVPLSLLYLDVDNFKHVNDAHGHAYGDRVLEEVALFLKRSVRRQMDRCYRIGGDEFAVLMLGAHAADAVTAIKRRRNELANNTVLKKDDVRLSVGAVELNGEAPTDLIRKADRCMYAAKRGAPLRNNGNICFAKI